MNTSQILHENDGGWQRLVFFIKRQKIVFSRSFSRFVTWGHGRYKGFKGGTRTYRVWTKNVFLTRTSQDTFSWSILHKNKRWKHLKFWTKTMDLSPFLFFIKRCCNSLERLFFHPEGQQTLFLDLFLINTEDEKTSTFLLKS